jgi:hypothetical protein
MFNISVGDGAISRYGFGSKKWRGSLWLQLRNSLLKSKIKSWRQHRDRKNMKNVCMVTTSSFAWDRTLHAISFDGRNTNCTISIYPHPPLPSSKRKNLQLETPAICTPSTQDHILYRERRKLSVVFRMHDLWITHRPVAILTAFWVLSAIYTDRVPFELLDSAALLWRESCGGGGQIVFLNLTTII